MDLLTSLTNIKARGGEGTGEALAAVLRWDACFQQAKFDSLGNRAGGKWARLQQSPLSLGLFAISILGSQFCSGGREDTLRRGLGENILPLQILCSLFSFHLNLMRP